MRIVEDVRCVVFDIDDTLYLERDYVRSGFAAAGTWVSRSLGLEGFAELSWRLFERGRRGTIFDEALASLGVRPERHILDELVRRYRAHVPSIALFPDARRCLDALRGAVFLGVISDGPLQSQRAKVEALGLTPLVDSIVLTAEFGEGYEKPHPRAFESVQATAGCGGASCVYVADNPAKDFLAPRHLGWQTVRVIRRLGLHASVASGPDVDATAGDLDELIVAGAQTQAGDRVKGEE